MATRYHEIAPKVISETEMLTDLINVCGKVSSGAARLIELNNGIHVDPNNPDRQRYNVIRSILKRTAVLEELLLALNLTSGQQTDATLQRAALMASLDKMVKLEHFHPEVRALVAERLKTDQSDPEYNRMLMEQLKDNDSNIFNANPYAPANREDFDDE